MPSAKRSSGLKFSYRSMRLSCQATSSGRRVPWAISRRDWLSPRRRPTPVFVDPVASADIILFVSASQMIMSVAGFGVESEFAWAIVRVTRRRLLLEGPGDLSADGAGAACSSHTCRYRRRLPRLSLGPRCVKGQRNLPIGGRETASGQLSCPLPGSYVAVSGQDLVAAGSACLAVPARTS